MKKLIEAVNKVMDACENVDKGMTIGRGQYAYKGVSDKDVKLMFNKAMRDNGLAIFTTKIEPTTTVERWEETYQGNTKQKQSVFTEVLVTYELHHVDGDSITLQGYGQGTDPQDKAAGKATTYALKYTLLYNFLVATGHIDDSDTTHSNEIQTPEPKVTPLKKPIKGTAQVPMGERIKVEYGDKVFLAIVKAVVEGKGTIEQAKGKYNIPKIVEDKLKEKIQALDPVIN